MKNFKLHQGLGTAVLNELRQIAPLPEEGYVAGGAVQAVVCKLANHSKLPINDVDVFMSIEQYAPKAGSKVFKTLSNELLCKTTGISVAYQIIDPYSGVFTHVDVHQRFELIKTFRKDLVNFVIYKNPYAGSKNTLRFSAQMLLNGFDLNCTQVAVDLKTGLLSWTRGFEFYLYNHELRVVNCHTPAHTAIRFLQKLHTLHDVYGNVEQNMEILSAAVSWNSLNSFQNVVANRFGQGYFNKLKTYGDSLHKYFEIQEDVDSNLYSFKSRFETSSDCEKIINTMGSYSVKGLADAYFERVRLKKTGISSFKSIVNLPQNEDVKSFIRVNNFLQTIQETQFYKEPVNLGKYRKFMAFYKFGGQLMSRGSVFTEMSMKEQVQCYENILKLEALLGPWVYGVLFGLQSKRIMMREELLNLETLKVIAIVQKEKLDRLKNVFKLYFDRETLLAGIDPSLKVRFKNIESLGEAMNYYFAYPSIGQKISNKVYSSRNIEPMFVIEVDFPDGHTERCFSIMGVPSGTGEIELRQTCQIFPKQGEDDERGFSKLYSKSGFYLHSLKIFDSVNDIKKSEAIGKLLKELTSRVQKSLTWNTEDLIKNRATVLKGFSTWKDERKKLAQQCFHDYIENNSLVKYKKCFEYRDWNTETKDLAKVLNALEVSEETIDRFFAEESLLASRLDRLYSLSLEFSDSHHSLITLPASDSSLRAHYLRVSNDELVENEQFKELLPENRKFYQIKDYEGKSSIRITSAEDILLDDCIPF